MTCYSRTPPTTPASNFDDATISFGEQVFRTFAGSARSKQLGLPHSMKSMNFSMPHKGEPWRFGDLPGPLGVRSGVVGQTLVDQINWPLKCAFLFWINQVLSQYFSQVAKLHERVLYLIISFFQLTMLTCLKVCLIAGLASHPLLCCILWRGTYLGKLKPGIFLGWWNQGMARLVSFSMVFFICVCFESDLGPG